MLPRRRARIRTFNVQHIRIRNALEVDTFEARSTYKRELCGSWSSRLLHAMQTSDASLNPREASLRGRIPGSVHETSINKTYVGSNCFFLFLFFCAPSINVQQKRRKTRTCEKNRNRRARSHIKSRDAKAWSSCRSQDENSLSHATPEDPLDVP